MDLRWRYCCHSIEPYKVFKSLTGTLRHVVAHHSIFDYRRALSPGGIYVMVVGASFIVFQLILLGPLFSMFGNKKMGLLLHKPNKGLDFMKRLFETGKVVPVIDRCYPLNAVAEAIQYFGAGRAKGKVVITVAHNVKN